MAKVEGVFANLLPIKIENTSDFGTVFVEALALASTARMCTGYVAAESVVELTSLLAVFENVKHFELVVGMAKFDGITRDQLSALSRLNSTLIDSGRGAVYVATALPIHAKVTLFEGSDATLLLGSSNLGSLTRATRQFETDLVIKDSPELFAQFEEFLEKSIRASELLTDVYESLKIVSGRPNPLENLRGVSRLETLPELVFEESKQFEIPVGVGEKSNLNTFFGQGRKSLNGRILPRPWYEVELIVPKVITSQPGYPVKDYGDGTIDVLTDDGYCFECKSSGDNSKNFRSKSDLETLGRWIKGRLEASGALEPGDLVTEDTLKKYGRSTISLKKIAGDSKWFLDFGTKNA